MKNFFQLMFAGYFFGQNSLTDLIAESVKHPMIEFNNQRALEKLPCAEKIDHTNCDVL